ncbi:hypothetical protein [uncultured Rummeliibacillus sp.]|uniref:hypothetical protein n=1 Tax=uncultured Rummeliibacillus sp. TaxID=762292 RepID=UPI0026040DFD|nr:hypothetical protein [uncultured Rummeliibacillus sp.]
MESSTCPKCGIGKIYITDEWDKEFDRLDDNVPAGDIIHNILADRGIVKYRCTNCDYTKLTD